MDLVRKKFSDIFERQGDDLLVKEEVSVNGVLLEKNSKIPVNQSFAGVNFFEYHNHDIAIEEKQIDSRTILVVKGFYV